MTTRDGRITMTVYHGKVLELVAIEVKNGKSYLRIKSPFEQKVELFWEIDHGTAKNLIKIFEFDGIHKYRLSFHTTFDTSNNQYTSLITRTYRDQSERMYFTCSENYKRNLNSIKSSQCMNDLKEQTFLSVNLSKNEVKQLEQKKEQNEAGISKGLKLPFKWVSVAMISVFFVILLGYSNDSYLNKNAINNVTTANAEVETAEDNLVNKKTIVTPAKKLVKADSAQSSLPYIELDDSITYSIPEGYVSLTFDDGPSKYTVKIIDILKKYNVGGTFFFIGNNVKKHPDYVRYVQANGYSIGSHSMNHLKMSDLSYEKQENELMQSAKIIEDTTNEKVVLLRPPYGALNEQTENVIHRYHDKIILWNRDPKDWKTLDADKIFNYVRDTEASGSIILLHESQAVIDALPKIIEHLQEQNLKIVNLY